MQALDDFLVFGAVNYGMNRLGVPYFYPLVTKCAVILAFVWLDVPSKRAPPRGKQA